ncbi:MAG TPA: Ig-like domain-containing protein [Longimicrobiales bacterium]
MTVQNGRRLAMVRTCALALGVLSVAVAGCGDNPAGIGLRPAATLTSTGATVYSVTLSPANPSIPVGGSVAFTAVPKDAGGNVLSGTVSCGWSSDWTGVATVTSAGVGKGVSLGTTLIKAGCGGIVGSTKLTVTSTPVAATVTASPASVGLISGGTQQLSVTEKDAYGNVLALPVSWASSAPGVATVSSTGLVSAVATGSSTVSATVSGVTALVSVTVTSSTVASVSVSPASATLAVAGTQQLVATARDAAGNVVTGNTVAWSSGAPSVATVSSSGLVSAVAAGSASISATIAGKSASAALSVTAPTSGGGTGTVTSVSISPSGIGIAVGASQQLFTTAKDSAGNVVTGNTATWSTDAPGVATVSATGDVTGVAAGSAVVTVTIAGVSASAGVSVGSSGGSSGGPAPALIFSDDFENGFAALQNGAGWLAINYPAVSLSTDVAHSGTYSAKFVFPGKPDCYDATAEQRFTLGRKMQEVWLEWYIYYPAGGEGGSAPYYHRWEYPVCTGSAQVDNNKFVALWGGTYQKEPTLMIQTWTTTLAMSVKPSAPGDSRIQTSATTAGGGGAAPGYANYMNFVSGAADRGRWIQIRLHARVADFGVNDGVVELWKDGVKILSNTTLPWYDSTNTANYLAAGYLLGWSDSGFTQTTNIYIDDFKIIGQNPGW